MAIDASEWGKGIVVTKDSRERVQQWMGYNERWRFKASKVKISHRDAVFADPTGNYLPFIVGSLLGAEWNVQTSETWERGAYYST